MVRNKLVYAFLREDDTPFYIGMGSLERCTNHKKGSRNYRWWEEMKSNPGYKFTIVDCDLSQKEAWDIEVDLIKEFGRQHIDDNGILTNIHPGGSFWGDHVVKSVVAFDLKGNRYKRFDSIVEARAYVGYGPSQGPIGYCCQYKQKSSKGYQWFYESEVGDIDYIGPVKRKRNDSKSKHKGSWNTSKKHTLDLITMIPYESRDKMAKGMYGEDFYIGISNRKECIKRRMSITKEEYYYLQELIKL